MKDHFKITHRGLTFSFLPPTSGERDNCQIAIAADGYGNNSFSLHTHFNPDCYENDLVNLVLLHRAIGHLINAYQPGIVTPLPDGDPSEVDALKVLYTVDQLWREGNS